MNQETRSVNETEEYSLGWYTNNPTYIAGPSNDLEWTDVESPDSITLSWDATTDSPHLSGVPSYMTTLSEAQEVAARLTFATSIVPYLTSLVHRERNHPEGHGLVLKRLSKRHDVQTYTYSQWSRLYVRNKVNTSLPLWESITAPSGWFAPNGDPEKFGTLFMYTAYEEEYQGSDEILRVRWCLGQVGRGHVEVASAAWDDADGVARLAQDVIENEAEAYLAMAALTDDAESLNDERETQDRRQSLLVSRDAFTRPRDRIRPRLVLEALSQAWGNTEYAFCATVKDHYYSKETRVYSLNDRDIFDGFRKNSPLNAAARILFEQNEPYRYSYQSPAPRRPLIPPSDFDGYAQELSALVNEKKLGTVLRVTYQKGVMFYVVKNVDLVMDYAPAVGIKHNHVVERYEPVSREWQPVKNAPTMGG